MTSILGISAFYHDSAASLLIDGKIIAAAQEERFTRIKHDSNYPLNAVNFVLNYAKVKLSEVDYVIFFEKPFLKFERLLETYVAFAPKGFIQFSHAMPKWLRDKLKLIKSAKITEKISKKQINNNNVYLVPAFTGLGAPYWKPNVRGILTGLTRDTGRNEIIRATLESVAYQTSDLLNAMKKDGLKPSVIKVDGGMANNYWFIQFLTDILNIKVLKPKVYETTSLGAAVMAGYYIGVYKSLSDITRNWRFDKKFVPKIVHKNRLKLLNGWHRAIRKTLR